MLDYVQNGRVAPAACIVPPDVTEGVDVINYRIVEPVHNMYRLSSCLFYSILAQFCDFVNELI
jgi:hypothetical protein